MIESEPPISFHPLSHADEDVRLFESQGRLLRGISAGQEAFFRGLFDSGIIEDLVDHGLLIETSQVKDHIEGFPFVLEHRRIPVVSYASEWSSEMLRDAASIILDVETRLAASRLTLRDAHPWNVIFDGPSPKFVDLGSVIPADDRTPWTAYDEFRRFFLNPLKLMENGSHRIARALLKDWDQGIDDHLVDSLGLATVVHGMSASGLRRFIPPRIRRAVRHRAGARVDSFFPPRTFSTDDRLDLLRQVRRVVQSLDLRGVESTWGAYYEGEFPSHVDEREWNEKHRTVARIIAELKPSSLLDIGSNRGWYAQLAAKSGTGVVALDTDERALDLLYHDARVSGARILPCFMDFRNPTPGLGIGNSMFPPARDRFRSAGVLMLALTHHLALKSRLRFEQIVDEVSDWAEQWAAIEFIPAEDAYVREWSVAIPSWYRLDSLLKSAERRFASITVLPSFPEPRVIVLCRR